MIATFRLPFVTEQWEHWIRGIGHLAAERGIEFSQAHANFYNFCDPAAKHRVGVAIENLWDYNIAPLRRYTTTAEELLDLVEELKKDYDNVRICWDFEHADNMKQPQASALKMIGHHLKATHVSDNIGIENDHILPFAGYTDWTEIMKLLKEIRYQGDFTYEIHRYTAQLPEDLVVPALKYSIEVGN